MITTTLKRFPDPLENSSTTLKMSWISFEILFKNGSERKIQTHFFIYRRKRQDHVIKRKECSNYRG